MTRASSWSMALVLLVTTCSGDPPAFYNPANGAITQCMPSDFDPSLANCIATYQNAGWVSYSKPIIGRETPPTASPQ
ncbi:MAG TPA: hypothetical protein VLX85_16750 [Stellaceae bacterium]|nr:hypothetical protein [Stellaceae bacterium]